MIGPLVIGVLLLLLLVALLVGVALVYDRCQRILLRKAFTARWSATGKDVLLVYSDSPHWKRYIEAHWLPRLGERAVVLNWSERAHWSERSPLEAAIVRRWAGRLEFNPLILVIPPHGPVTMVRFWKAFRDYKHGKERALREAEQRVARALGASSLAGA
jgi:hypothetical protein